MGIHNAAAVEIRFAEMYDAVFRAGGEGEAVGFGGEGGVGAEAEGELVGAVFEVGGEGLEAGGAEVG